MDDVAEALEGSSIPGTEPTGYLPRVVEVDDTGDLVLDMTFENSRAVLKASRKVLPRTREEKALNPAPAPKQRVGFRVKAGLLKKNSKYFEKLLGDQRFQEGKAVTEALAALSLRGINPASASVQDLPWVKITDDDEATRLAHRETAFGDMLRILHGKPVTIDPAMFDFAATLAVLADRFDCVGPVARFASTGLKLRWPVTQKKPVTGESLRMTRNAENVLRQKLFISWLLNQPVRFQAASREIIMNGSCKWTAFPDQDSGAGEATWWYLPDGLEQELQYRRECILSTIASVPRHFLDLYTSRTRQCQLGYDSSTACDSYQLGEMFKFLRNKGLFYLVDFSPASLDSIEDTSLLQVDTILAALKQCPSYQIDKNHANCGLRTRMLPIIDFIASLLSTQTVPLSHASWKQNSQSAAWLSETAQDKTNDASRDFQFTRSMASDPRLRFENVMGAERFARDVFTASSWNWTGDQ
ncbi:hypothetical protein BX600DRAFT_506339 [Xylariales sp. PMI_506]|nr:hypothetical protein BX600DRAFT_506339 [Xylariales sp. PMI_506]